MTLQCVIVFISADNTTTVQPTVWSRNISGMITTISAQTPIPNHRLVFNSTTGAFTDLVITDVTLEDNNTVYICSTVGATITSSVVLNVAGTYICNICMYEHVNVKSSISKYTNYIELKYGPGSITFV